MATDPVVDGFSRLGQVDLCSNALKQQVRCGCVCGGVTHVPHISEKENLAGK